MTTTMSHLVLMMPELMAAISALLALIFGVFKKKDTTQITLHVVLGILLGLLFVVLTRPHGQFLLFHDAYVCDYFAVFFKSFILMAAFLMLFSSRDILIHQGILHYEYSVLILLSVLGMMIMVSANSLLTVFMGLELQSLSLYILTAMRRDHVQASEAGVKYFILGAVSSGLLLYGMSLIYGLTGHLMFQNIAAALTHGGASVTLWVGIVCFVVGILFKISVVPFHMWTPDVYQGAPTVMTGFLATVPKIAATALLLRILFGPLAGVISGWQPILEIMAILSMVLGSFAALFQKDIKRLLAYSTIGNMGYALMGVVVGSEPAVQSTIIYIVIYVLTVIGFFSCLNRLSQQGHEINHISDLAGGYKQAPGASFAMIFFLFSFAGVPPLAGFLGKLYVFKAAVAGNFMTLAIVGVLTSVVAAGYYLWIVKVMVMDESSSPVASRGSTDAVSMLISSIVILMLTYTFIVPTGLLTMTGAATASLMGLR